MTGNRGNTKGTAVVSEAVAIPATVSERDYPPPPGYKFVHHVKNGEDFAMFLENMAAVRACCRAGYEYALEYPQHSTTTPTKQSA